MNEAVFTFDSYRLDVSRRTLSKSGAPVAISARLFEILRVLVESSGEVVTKDQLRAEVWKEPNISDNSIDKQMSLLRTILGEQTTGSPFVETVPRQGYRFIGDVKREAGLSGKRPAVQTWVAAASALILVLVASIFAIRRHGAPPSAAPDRRETIAVLPFRDLTRSTELAWLSTGIQEMLKADLSGTGRLRSAATDEVNIILAELGKFGRSQTGELEVEKLPAETGVSIVISGTYAVSGSELRVDASAFDVRRHKSVATASETGGVGDLFEVVRRAARTLGAPLEDREWSAEELAQVRSSLPPNSADNRTYFEALAKLRTGDPLTARGLLLKVLSANDRFAQAHAALADALLTLGYQTRALEEARRARELSGGLGREQVLSIDGQYYMCTGDWSRTVKTYTSLYSFFPDDSEYALKLASAQAKAGNKDDAYATLAEVRKRSRGAEDDLSITLAEAQIAEFFSQFQRERDMGLMAENKARTLGAELQAARAELMESWAADNIGEFRLAESKATDAQRTFVRLGDRGSEAHAWKNLGDVFIDQGKIPEATAAYQKSIAMFREIGWVSGQTIGLNNLGYVLLDHGDLTQTESTFREALTIARTTGDQRLIAMVLNGVAIVLRRKNDFAGAEQAYLEAAGINKRLGDKGKLGTDLNNLAVVYMRSGDLLNARKNFEDALNLFEATGRRPDVAMCLGNLGNLALIEGDLSSAEEMFRQDAEVNKKAPEPTRAGYELQGLGEIRYQQNDFSSARSLLQKALEGREKTHEDDLVAENRLALAQLDLDEGRLSAAEAEATQARNQYARQKENSPLAWSEALLARILVAAGKVERAEASAAEAERLSQALDDRMLAAQTRLDLGRAYMTLHRTADARTCLHLALSDSEQHHFVVCKLAAESELAKLDLEAGSTSARQQLSRIRDEAQRRGLSLIAQRDTVQILAAGR